MSRPQLALPHFGIANGSKNYNTHEPSTNVAMEEGPVLNANSIHLSVKVMALFIYSWVIW